MKFPFPKEKTIKIDASRRGELPSVEEAVPFASPDGLVRGWKVTIPGGHPLATPAVADGRVFLGGGRQVHVASLDGTLGCFEQESGRLLWQEARNATSAPAVWQNQCYFSQRQEIAGAAAEVQQMEWLARKYAAAGTPTEHFLGTAAAADYLDHGKRQRRSPHYGAQAAHDAGVGFAAFKGDAKIHQAMHNLGTAHVYGVWSYQGCKPFLAGGGLFSSQGDTVQRTDSESKEVFWKGGKEDADLS